MTKEQIAIILVKLSNEHVAIIKKMVERMNAQPSKKISGRLVCPRLVAA